MGVLSDVLNYKSQREAQESADIAAIPQAINNFLSARQQAQDNLFKELTLKATLAKAGLRIDATGRGLERDESLVSETDKFLKMGKLAGAAKNIYEIGGIPGFGQTQQQVGQADSQNQGDYKKSIASNYSLDPIQQRKINEELAKSEIKEIGEARKKFNDYVSSANDSLGALERLEARAKKLPDYKLLGKSRGFAEQTYAKSRAALDEYSKDENVTRYSGVLNQELIPLARKLAEEKGPITDSDVERITKGLGDLTTPFEDKKALYDELRTKVREAIESKMDIAKISKDEFKDRYGKAYSKIYPGDDAVNDSGFSNFGGFKVRVKK